MTKAVLLTEKYVYADDSCFERLSEAAGIEREEILLKAKASLDAVLEYNCVPPEAADSIALNIQACLASCKEEPFKGEGSGFRFSNGLFVNYTSWDYWGVFVGRQTSVLTPAGKAVLAYLDEKVGEVDIQPNSRGQHDLVRLPPRQNAAVTPVLPPPKPEA